MVILNDSGSSHCFVNADLVPLMLGISVLSTTLIVQVANGQVLKSTSEIVQAVWSIQGYQFQTTLKVIHLPFYDMIVGMDWLEEHSPIKIDWLHKWMIINWSGFLFSCWGFSEDHNKLI
jgi:hypothetical protein